MEKHIVILGATGGTGQHLVQQALERGYAVTALVRSPEKLTHQHERLQVVISDIFNQADVERALAGKDALLSVLGTGPSIGKVTFFSESTKVILQAMQETGVQRLICVTAGAVKRGRIPDVPLWLYYLLRLFFGRAYADMRRMEKLIEQSDRDWTIVRPPRLLNQSATGHYRAAPGYSLPKGFDLSRADLAHFMLKQLETDEFLREAVAVAY